MKEIPESVIFELTFLFIYIFCFNLYNLLKCQIQLIWIFKVNIENVSK